MKWARKLTTAESRRRDFRGRHFALRVEVDKGGPFIVLRCPERHEYAWRDKHPGVNYEFLARWWGESRGGVTSPRDACPECPRGTD